MAILLARSLPERGAPLPACAVVCCAAIGTALHIRALALLGALVVGAGVAAEELPDPAAPKSSAAFLEHARGAELRGLQQLRARYDAYLADHPRALVARIERCRFLAGADCGDDGECPFWDDHETCVEDLERDFASDPDVRLYLLDQGWGDELIASAKALLAGDLDGWSPVQVANVHEQLARAYAHEDDRAKEVVEHATRAQQLDPSLDLSLTLARAHRELGAREPALAALRSRLDVDEPYWNRLQRIGELADLEAFEDAAKALESLTPPDGQEPDHGLIARVYVGAGRVDGARRALDEAEAKATHESRVRDLRRLRFELELAHGDQSAALAAYTALRDAGWRTDAFLVRRFELAHRFPLAPWQLRDIAGAFALVALIAVLLTMPLLVLLPVHYAGLVRAQRTPGSAPLGTPWRLRDCFVAVSLLLLAGVPFAMFDGGATLDAIVDVYCGDATYPEASGAPTPRLLALATLLTTAALVLGVAYLWPRQIRASLGPGRWSLARSAGYAVLMLVALRAFLFLYVAMLPESWREVMREASQASPLATATVEACRAVRDVYGLFALFGFMVVAVPLVEEILFRGVLLAGFRRHLAFAWANGLQAALFAVGHEPWPLLPYFFGIALCAGWLAQRSQSLRAPVLLHAANNALAFAALALQAARSA